MIKNIHTWLISFFLLASLHTHSQVTIQNGAELTVQAGEEMTIQGGLVNAGTVSGKGLFTIGDDFINQGVFAIEIDATSHTTVNVGTKLTLNGMGTFTVNDNSSPTSGDQLTIVTAGFPISSSFSNSESNNWLANYNLPNAGEFTISYLSSLPVELIDFGGQSLEEGIQLDWQTASEQNNKGFVIQRSRNTIDWESLDFVEGVGNSSELQSYTFIDREPFIGINYYRLKQIDFDESYEFSDIINIDYFLQSNEVVISPNPATDILYVDLSNDFEKATDIQLINEFGQVVFQTKKEKEERNFLLDVSSYPSGIYYLQLTQNYRLISKKIIIQKL